MFESQIMETCYSIKDSGVSKTLGGGLVLIFDKNRHKTNPEVSGGSFQPNWSESNTSKVMPPVNNPIIKSKGLLPSLANPINKTKTQVPLPSLPHKLHKGASRGVFFTMEIILLRLYMQQIQTIHGDSMRWNIWWK